MLQHERDLSSYRLHRCVASVRREVYSACRGAAVAKLRVFELLGVVFSLVAMDTPGELLLFTSRAVENMDRAWFSCRPSCLHGAVCLAGSHSVGLTSRASFICRAFEVLTGRLR